jgi:CheY-like chemotaxis protein
MAIIRVVDDHAIDRAFLVTLLGYYGYHMLEAGDGTEALEMARVERPNLIISDILMPTRDGYEFVRQLRADPSIANTAIIFYTANYR